MSDYNLIQSDVDGDFEKFEEIGDELFCQISDELLSNSEQHSVDVKQEIKLEIPHAFPFPCQPYSIQVDLMRKLYEVLELGKVGIFESPTGTGKSLSLICGALTWLKNFEEQKQRELNAILDRQSLSEKEVIVKQEAGAEESCTDDWISEFARKQELEEKAKKLKDEQEQRQRREAQLQQLRKNLRPNPHAKRKRNSLDDQFEELFKDASEELRKKFEFELAAGEADDIDEADEDFVVTEYISDDDSAEETTKKTADNENQDEEHITKIYYCSRTHSQLAQFVREVQKSPFRDQTRVVTLGSRQNLCVNEAVKRLKSLSLINDRCIELQKNKSVSTSKDGDKVTKKQKCSGCPFYKQETMVEFRDRALIEIKDIEQLVTMGKQMKACPYYGTRFAIPSAQLVVLPYNTLLHRSTRESCGIRLTGNIVIIDEGHNLMETITNIHSVEVTGPQLCCAYSQLSQYVDRYRQRLKAKNVMYIKQLLFILGSFIKALGGKAGCFSDNQQIKTESRILTINDFLFDTHLDNLNLFKVQRYCERSMIAKKLHGFIEKYHCQVTPAEKKKENAEPTTWALSNFLTEISQNKETANLTGNDDRSQAASSEPEPHTAAAMSSPLMHIEGLLEALTNADKDGRIFVSKLETLSKSSIKFMLLNPAVHFSDVLSEARAVIIAGGTMQPVSELKEQLLLATGMKRERILEFTCGHVIPADHLLPIALARGSSGLELDFTYQSRATPEMMDELGRVVYNVSNVVSGGIVCFFPSYEYEKTVYAHWEQAGFLQKIGNKKKIFREPKQANQVERLMQEYALFIKRHNPAKKSQFDGAVLFSVVGGKMSEGINFSDDLGRCVIMIGLPYPNVRSPELKEKMDYLNANMPKSPDGKLPGQIHFENLCMKAVNQSIGRAIRHRDDFAAVLLLDHRYMRASVKAKLPGWIKERLCVMERFGPAFSAIRKFFSDRATEHEVKSEPS